MIHLRYAFVLLIVAVCACQPSDRTPGLWLSGTDTEFPADWRFTDAHDEVYVQVATPYLLPHSVTIWCAQVNGTLYVAAARPDEKNWPGWVADDPDVRLKVGDAVYDATLHHVADEAALAPVMSAYAAKYDLEGLGGSTRVWRVDQRH